ncbi:MAG: hypothetical protein ACKOPE_09600 [Novosphingobium sp.]
MSRSDWNIVAALAGLATLLIAFGLGAYVTALNYPQEQRYQSYRYTAEQPDQAKPTLAAKADPQPLQYRTPCRQPEGQGESDLCAQWRAANAAEDSALWTKWGVWIGIIGSSLLLWQIMLTRKAVEDTSEATEAMREANKIAGDAQRAWISLAIRPVLIESYGNDGLLFEIEYTCKNIGSTVATHFDVEAGILFPGQSEDIDNFIDRVEGLINDWKRDYDMVEGSSLLPGDTEIDKLHDVESGPRVNWWKGLFADAVRTQPIMIVAAFYRTVVNPNVLQISWRTWYVSERRKDGGQTSFVRQGTRPLSESHIAVAPFRTSLMHEEHTANDDSRNREGY